MNIGTLTLAEQVAAAQLRLGEVEYLIARMPSWPAGLQNTTIYQNLRREREQLIALIAALQQQQQQVPPGGGGTPPGGGGTLPGGGSVPASSPSPDTLMYVSAGVAALGILWVLNSKNTR